MSRDFGIYPEGKTPRLWWGARAIIERDRTLFLLPDRQGFEAAEQVTPLEREMFIEWVNKTVTPALKTKAKDGFFREWSDLVEYDFDEDGVRYHCEATPKNSGGGYLYIGCWTKEEE